MLNFSIDDNLKEFNRTFEDYKKWQIKQPAEIVNGKLYFVALQAMRKTKTADKGEIAQKLNAPARLYPNVPLAAILVNKQLKAKGKKGLTGPKMAKAVDKLIRKQQSKTQFLRSGWIESLKTLDFWNKKNSDNLKFVKRFAPKRPEGVKAYGRPKGKCIYAKPDRAKTWGMISNLIGVGKQASPTVKPLLLKGLSQGIREEMRSMKVYIERKLTEQFNKMNRNNKV